MIGAGYHGPLYAEISPKTFPVLLREGSRLSQVRFRTGDAILNADELDALHDKERLVDADDADLPDPAGRPHADPTISPMLPNR